MPSPAWIAAALGLAGGLLLAYAVGSTILPRWVEKSDDMPLLVRLAFAGTVVALLPALLLSLVAGAALGGAWGERFFVPLGFPSGAPIGLALGVAVVFALVVLAGAASGLLLGKALLRRRQLRG